MSLTKDRKGRTVYRFGQPFAADLTLSIVFGVLALVLLALSLGSSKGGFLSVAIALGINVILSAVFARSAASSVLFSTGGIIVRNTLRTHRMKWSEDPHFSLGESQRTGTKPVVLLSGRNTGRAILVRAAVPWYRATTVDSSEIVFELNRAARRLGDTQPESKAAERED